MIHMNSWLVLWINWMKILIELRWNPKTNPSIVVVGQMKLLQSNIGLSIHLRNNQSSQISWQGSLNQSLPVWTVILSLLNSNPSQQYHCQSNKANLDKSNITWSTVILVSLQISSPISIIVSILNCGLKILQRHWTRIFQPILSIYYHTIIFTM